MNSENFSKDNTKKKKIITLIKYLFAISVIASVIAAGIIGGVFFAYIDTAGEISAEQLKLKDSKTILYDMSNKEFETIHGSDNREWADSNQIPKYLKQAFISIEDERFYKHNGIDFRRIASAVFNAIKPGGSTHGASTITQQLVRNLTGETEVKYKRKIQEQWKAIQLEKKLTKEQILELYLNIVPLNNGIYGVQAGSKAYFNKDVSELSLAECASLAAITNLPVYYDPSANPENNKKRQENILAKMKELGYIDDELYKSSITEELTIQKGIIEKISNLSYFTDQVINDVVSDLQNKKGYSKGIAEQMVYGGGLKIYTTVNPKVQRSIENYYSNVNNFVKTSGTDQPQSAMVIIDPKNGQIKGIVGGIGPKKGQRTLNRATQSVRQPGSSIKPLSVYSPAIEKGKVTPNTIINDSPYNPYKSKVWEPNNYDFKFWGNITLRTAVKNSRNIPAIKVLEKVGLDYSYNFLKNLGITSLKRSDKDYAPLALGAMSVGVSPVQLAAGYVPLVNGGVYIKPYTYLKVIDSEGKILLDNSAIESRAVMNENTSYIMTDLLTDVVNSGTGTLAKLNNMPTAGKTGTTSDMKDKWFVGYTPYYVGAVWYGYDTPKKLPENTWNTALLTWKSVMQQIHKELPRKEFKVPGGISVEVAICSISGKKATSFCYNDINGSTVKKESFIQATEPKTECDVHKKIRICKTSNQLATLYCPSQDIEIKSYVPGISKNIPTVECEIHGSKSNTNEPANNNPEDNINESINDDSQNNKNTPIF